MVELCYICIRYWNYEPFYFFFFLLFYQMRYYTKMVINYNSMINSNLLIGINLYLPNPQIKKPMERI